MVSIASLLNPCSRPFRDYRETSSPCSSAYDSSPSSPLPPGKKQKLSKDAAIFAKGKTRGEIRYPPHEIEDEDIAKQHARFQLYPRGRIAEYCRHIPYNSEKKLFLEKTGRESFEGETSLNTSSQIERTRLMLHPSLPIHIQDECGGTRVHRDVGLQHWFGEGHTVFQVLQLFEGMEIRNWMCRIVNSPTCSQTTPAKVLSNNPGLREITHSITGGALAAQGMWSTT